MPKVKQSFNCTEEISIALSTIAKENQLTLSEIIEHALLIELIAIEKYGIDFLNKIV
jgi:hypothetical protein